MNLLGSKVLPAQPRRYPDRIVLSLNIFVCLQKRVGLPVPCSAIGGGYILYLSE
jgi:hypothetical protein